jgi:hypothetical protein
MLVDRSHVNPSVTLECARGGVQGASWRIGFRAKVWKPGRRGACKHRARSTDIWEDIGVLSLVILPMADSDVVRFA